MPDEVDALMDQLVSGDAMQVVGSVEAMMSGVEPSKRELTLDDIEDDCPVCQANRRLIEAGTPPTVLVFELPEEDETPPEV